MSSVLEVQPTSTGVDDVHQTYRGVVALPGIWSLQEQARPTVTGQEVIRRVANVAAAAVLFVLTLPLMAVIALLVRFSSPGPVIYVQTRVGLDRRGRQPSPSDIDKRRFDYGGRLFQIYKFRTMTWDANVTVQSWAKSGDPRVTRLGRVLRKYRLDELPQLVNVLKGEMNLVGPRPEQPRLFAELREQIDGYSDRQRVLPGITGWAQINHGYDATVEDVRKKLHYDLQYIERASVFSDLGILLRTIPVMLFQRGAL